MTSSVLVLDAAYQPICTMSWERAITLYFQGKAEILAEYADRFVHSVSQTFKIPSVIRFFKYVFKRKRAVKFSRDTIYNRDNGQCTYCGIHVSRREFTYDHIIPRVQGGRTTFMNVCVSCQPCNSKKDGRTPEQAGMKLLRKPTVPSASSATPAFRVDKDSIPETWKDYLSAVYWHGELENDNP